MKNCYMFFLLFCTSFGCVQDWDDPIPEGAVLRTPFLISEITEEGRLMLDWSSPVLCAGFCNPTVEGSSYEIFGKFPGRSDFIRLPHLDADQRVFVLDDLTFGQPYEFYVTSHRAGKVTISNKVMTIPHPVPEYETLMRFDSLDQIYHLKMNRQGDKFMFISNYLWTDGGQDYGTLSLFLHDLLSAQTDLIKLDSFHPQWSADGRKVVFVTTEGSGQIAQGYTPSRLLTFDVETKEIISIVEGSYQQSFPSFGKEDKSVLFLADSLKRGEIRLWKTDFEANTQVLGLPFPLPDQVAGLSLVTGMDASVYKDIVVLDHLSTVEGRTVYNIYGVEFGEQVKKEELVGSLWNDRAPVFSPFEENVIAFLSDRSGTEQVWTLDISSGMLNQLSFFQDGNYISGGNSVSWTDQGHSIVLLINNAAGSQQLVKLSVAR